MFLLLDNIIIRLLAVAIRIASIWNIKARLWLQGRKNLLDRITTALRENSKPVIWMHSASLGEFEQGRFLIESIRTKYPGYCIVITFFSPSGYEVMKNYQGADFVFYLPEPTNRKARKFIQLLNPELVLWIKYDYWYHYLHELKRRKIPVLLVSAVFTRRHSFFKWYGPLYTQMLRCFTWLFVQDENSVERLNDIGLTNVSVSGDTRFDRVVDIAGNFEEIPAIREFIGNAPVIVAGSTWPEDEEEIDHYANVHPEIKFILVPHEIGEDHLKDIEKLFRTTIRYSELVKKQTDLSTINTLIIDNIGMLSRLYRYATITFVGGGFGDEGVHNVLEAAVYGKPVIFGPVFNQFRESIDLLEEGAAFTVDNALDLEKTFNDLLNDNALYRECCEGSHDYVYSHKGATERILSYIQENRLLMS
ncbi:MAG TPA: glycosyltransferase N-terminal domain-containing protein [Flavitalea sp.]|nr:glycosyltransferase N-terminal domain-containing protein [Flavitalea sp.]